VQSPRSISSKGLRMIDEKCMVWDTVCKARDGFERETAPKGRPLSIVDAIPSLTPKFRQCRDFGLTAHGLTKRLVRSEAGWFRLLSQDIKVHAALMSPDITPRHGARDIFGQRHVMKFRLTTTVSPICRVPAPMRSGWSSTHDEPIRQRRFGFPRRSVGPLGSTWFRADPSPPAPGPGATC